MKDFDEFASLVTNDESNEEFQKILEDMRKKYGEVTVAANIDLYRTLLILRKYHEWVNAD